MKKIKLGRTGLDISQVILGGGWVGGLFIDPNFDIMEKAIELSIKAGINWIDTAESYSDGKSEKNIGYLISSLPTSDKSYLSFLKYKLLNISSAISDEGASPGLKTL